MIETAEKRPTVVVPAWADRTFFPYSTVVVA